MDVDYHRIAGRPGLEDALHRTAARFSFKQGEPTGAAVRGHLADGLAMRLIAASAFVAALFALIGGAIELALVL